MIIYLTRNAMKESHSDKIRMFLFSFHNQYILKHLIVFLVQYCH